MAVVLLLMEAMLLLMVALLRYIECDAGRR